MGVGRSRAKGAIRLGDWANRDKICVVLGASWSEAWWGFGLGAVATSEVWVMGGSTCVMRWA